MRGVWHYQDRRRRGPRELTGIVDLTGGKEYPTARVSGPCPRKVWRRVQELAGRARIRLARGGVNRDAGSPSRESKKAIDDELQDATSVCRTFHIVKLAGDALGHPRNRVLLPVCLHHPRPGLHRCCRLDRRLLQPPPYPHQLRWQIPPPSNTNYTKRSGQ